MNEIKSGLSGFARLMLCGLSTITILAVDARAQITPVAVPFSADVTETWESFPNFLSLNPLGNPTTIMGGLAQISSPQMAVYEPGVALFGLGESGHATVSDGAKGHGLNGFAQTATIDFSTSVTAFGAFWGASTNFSPTTVTVTFFDQSLAQIGAAQQFSYSRESTRDGLLEWHGWKSTEPVRRITYFGQHVVNDGMRVNVVPEPAALVLATMGIVAICAVRFRARISGG